MVARVSRSEAIARVTLGAASAAIAVLGVNRPELVLVLPALAGLGLWMWRDPTAAAVLLVALMGNSKVHYYTGSLVIFPEYPIVLLALALWGVQWLRGGRGAGERVLTWLFAGFAVLSLASIAFAIAPGRVVARFGLLLLCLGVFGLVLRGLGDRRETGRALVTLEVSAFVVAAYGVLQIVAGFVGFNLNLDALEAYGSPEFEYGVGAPVVHQLTKIFRANSFFNDPNILGGYIGMVTPLVLALRNHHARTGRRLRAAGEGVLLLVLGVCMLLTLSRSGLIALGAGCLTVMAFSPRSLFRPALWLGGGGLVAVSWAASLGLGVDPAVLLSRLSQSFDLGDISNRLHFDVAAYAVSLFLRFPLTGAGMRNFGLYWASDVNPHQPNMIAHNAYLGFFAETGLLGGLAFVALAAGILLRPWRAARRPGLRRQDPELHAWCVGLLGGLVALTVSNLFYDYYLRTFTWVFSGIAVATARLAAPAAADRPALGRGAAVCDPG
jgi:O-antigen ligase